MGATGPLGVTAEGWEGLFEGRGLPRYRGRQVFEALHRQGVRDYGKIGVLPRDLRARLSEELPIRLPEIARREPSADGSVKYGLKLADGALIEAVFMPGEPSQAQVNEFEDARATTSTPVNPKPKIQNPKSASPKFTVCLSSQTGCAVDCAFCVTGRLGGGRNLTADEIVGQLYAVLDDAGLEAPGARVVFMGM